MGLGVDLDWRMHQVSDRQRRRVQILLGLIRPFKILLLDEVTVSLDVVVRQDLLRYLCNKGHTGWQGKIENLEFYQQLRAKGEPSPLLRIAEKWLREKLIQKKKKKKKES